MESRLDVKNIVKESDAIIVTAHNYYSNVNSKEKIIMSTIETIANLGKT